MSFQLNVLLMGLLSGAMGGIAAFLHTMFQGFNCLPNKGFSKAKGIVVARRAFCLARLLFGGIIGIMVSVNFMAAVSNGTMHVDTVFNFACLAGFAGANTFKSD